MEVCHFHCMSSKYCSNWKSHNITFEMLLLRERNIILYYLNTIYIVLVLQELVLALRNPMRSVEICDRESRYKLPEFNKKEVACRLHCEKTYINFDKKIKDANLKLAKFQIKSATSDGVSQCCCLINTPWPDYVAPIAIGRTVWTKEGTAKTVDCLPLLVNVRLSTRSKDNYRKLCTHLNNKLPLTMLELVEFSEAAAYLNYVQPKHPFITKTLRLKEVNVVNQSVKQQLLEVFESLLLDSYKPLEQYEGYRLVNQKLREFYTTIKSLNQATRSRVVARAFDDYITSYVLVDITAANKHLNELNKLLFVESEIKSIENFDKYDPTFIDKNFRTQNCKLILEFEAKLSKYLSNVQTTLAALFEKLIYEHMKEQFEPLKELIHFAEVYKGIAKVKCSRVNKQSNVNQRRKS